MAHQVNLIPNKKVVNMGYEAVTNQFQPVDHRSAIPFYVQVSTALQDVIERGEWEPGTQLPGELELCQTFDVSRTVIRQALQEMELDGLIVRRKGKGTFVAAPKIIEGLFQKLTGFYQDMVDRGHQPITRVLKQETVPADSKVAGYLGLKRGTKAICIERLRFVKSEPIVLVTTYLPYSLCAEILKADLRSQSLYQILEERYGLIITRGRRTLEAVAADEREAELLQVEKGAPLMLLDSVSFLKDGTPIEYYHAVHRGDRSRFEVELVRIHEHRRERDSVSDRVVGRQLTERMSGR
jgi:GntR family transcriptional regulator